MTDQNPPPLKSYESKADQPQSRAPRQETRRGSQKVRKGPPKAKDSERSPKTQASRERYRPDFKIEDSVRRRSGNASLYVAGVDEVGRGALAGPVMAAAVVLRGDHKWLGELDDSKRLGWRKREELHGKILEEAMAVGIGYANATEIDKDGISAASGRAMVKAYQEVVKKLGPAATAAVVDGAALRGFRDDLGGEHSAFVDKADQRSLSVGAASIVAKVMRDRYMRLESKVYSGWGFERHVGYGTPEHLEALKRHGASPLHRKTFAPVAEALRGRRK